jgi:hypothetical protein
MLGGQLFNPLNAELNPVRHLLALVGARHIVHVSRVKLQECAKVLGGTGGEVYRQGAENFAPI